MSRVYSAKIAGIKAADEGLEVAGCAMASDAFFPFRDGIDAAAMAGVTCVIFRFAFLYIIIMFLLVLKYDGDNSEAKIGYAMMAL